MIKDRRRPTTPGLKHPGSLATGLLAALVATPAMAHSNVDHARSFALGVLHPFSGADHLIAMTAVGLWAAMRGASAVWAWPLSFLAGMILGGAQGPFMTTPTVAEPATLASVIALGLALASAPRAPLPLGLLLTLVFGMAHGAAHGLEFSGAHGFASYAAGFTLSTAALHLGGLLIGLALSRPPRRDLARWLGGGIAAWGALTALGSAL